MTSEPPPRFEGVDAFARATALAGWLAEQGHTQVLIESRAGAVELLARRSDLPGELLAHSPCTLTAGEHRFRIDDRTIETR